MVVVRCWKNGRQQLPLSLLLFPALSLSPPLLSLLFRPREGERVRSVVSTWVEKEEEEEEGKGKEGRKKEGVCSTFCFWLLSLSL